MKTLHISVNNKIATYLKRDGVIVCGNSDYEIEFNFDADWEKYDGKTARFKYNNQHIDVAFVGNTVAVPAINNTTRLEVGVYTGDISTSTLAEIPCLLSSRCGESVQAPNYLTVTSVDELPETAAEGTIAIIEGV